MERDPDGRCPRDSGRMHDCGGDAKPGGSGHHSGAERATGSDPGCVVESVVSYWGAVHGAELLRDALHALDRGVVSGCSGYGFADLHRKCGCGEDIFAGERGQKAVAGGTFCLYRSRFAGSMKFIEHMFWWHFLDLI